MKNLDAFERSVNESLEHFEVPYNSADWSQMEKVLDSARGPAWLGTASFYAALLVGMLAVGSPVYFAVAPDNLTRDLVANNGDLVEGNNPGTTTVPTDLSNEAGMTELQTDGDGQDGANSLTSAPEKALTAASTTHTQRNVGGTQATNTSSPALKAVVANHTPVRTGGSGMQPKAGGAFMASVSEGCENTTVDFKVPDQTELGIRYLWNFGDGSFSDEPNPSHAYIKPGKFKVALSKSSLTAGQFTNEPFVDEIVIHEVPEAAFNVLKQEYTGRVPSVHFENRSHGAVQYNWNFGDGGTSTIPHPDHVYRSKGDYAVTLIATNDMGCTDIVEKVIKIENDYNLLAPAAFSPNSDGNEDFFMPQALKDLAVKFKLSIYEPKTARLVYETSDATKPWTGRVMNRSEECLPGDYVWMVKIQEGLHLGEITYEGKVSLVK